ncbi:MAG TPA: tRNA uridine-5-carboxymethylaminomethyl(34) synthesis GTPase MnmE [Vicinamibacterales bacterium]|jgi:tRNA modification GTPase|nr:tRNA uridine-5-carboxymethylaminomethyl(34) synthesis GTPase MnmE [Vicinamibacterales bacterium]
MFSPSDTIVAIATPAGRGGIGVVRISGPQAQEVAATVAGRSARFEARHATLTDIRADGIALDRAVVTFFPSPHSYTGEDVVEISGHGSPVVLRAIVAAAMRAGARLAEPGEFTFRAYLHGRMDLVQAEAVRDLVDAVTPLQARAAFDQLEGTLTTRIREIDTALFELSARVEASLDFPEEGYHFIAPGSAAQEILAICQQIELLLSDARRGRLVREGAQVVILGRPNSGKSSLFNRLAGSGRAIVTDIPGTTRDLVTELIDLEGMAVTLVDTAGLHGAPADVVEQEGIARARAAEEIADLAIVMIDRSRSLNDDDRALVEGTIERPRLVIASKSDLPASWSAEALGVPVIQLSATTGEGIDRLRGSIATALSGTERLHDTPAVTNARHVDLLAKAGAVLQRAAAAAHDRTSEEFVAADLAEARALLEEVTGVRTPDDVLAEIFGKFCIGK